MSLTNADLTRCAVLALACEQPRHGWAIARELSPDSDLGRVWAVSRQLTYRAIETLIADELLQRGEVVDGLGPERVVLRPSKRGVSVNQLWLDAPVSHVRDVRTELILKLRLRDRATLPRHEFIERQKREFAAVVENLTRATGVDIVDVWRRESAMAASRFLDAISK